MQMNPTAEQLAIVQSSDPVVMVEAVAGAGKTTVLSWILRNVCQKLPAAKALALCFSEGAKERFREKFNEEGVPRGVVIQSVDEFAREQISRLAGAGQMDQPLFYDADEQIRPHIVAAAESVWSRYDDREIRTDFDFSFDNNERVEAFIQLLVKLKATLVTLRFDDHSAEEIAESLDTPVELIEICMEYEQWRCQDGEFQWQSRFDHVTDLVAILRRRPELLATMPRYGICVVDEWHDVNAAELELIQSVFNRTRLIVVGDRDQIINSERGADPALSSNGFDLAFPRARRYPLSRTFRFGPGVSKPVSRMMNKTCMSAEGLHTTVSRRSYGNEEGNDCARKVIERIDEMVKRGQEKLSDIAVVVRDADHSIAIENLLIDREIAYRCSGFSSYLLRPEILMLRGLLHLASGSYATLKGDPDTCGRMVRSLGLYASARFDSERDYNSLSAADQLLSPEKRNEKLWKEAERIISDEPSTLEFFFTGRLCRHTELDSNAILRWKTRFSEVALGLKTMAATNPAWEILEAAANRLELASATSRVFVNRGKADSARRSINSFVHFARRYPDFSASQFLDELAVRQQKTSKKQNYLKSRAQLDLTTVQFAKGKEWPHVLIPYLERNEFPRTTNIAEERRLLYVAATRAIESLTIFEPDESQSDRTSVLIKEMFASKA